MKRDAIIVSGGEFHWTDDKMVKERKEERCRRRNTFLGYDYANVICNKHRTCNDRYTVCAPFHLKEERTSHDSSSHTHTHANEWSSKRVSERPLRLRPLSIFLSLFLSLPYLCVRLTHTVKPIGEPRLGQVFISRSHLRPQDLLPLEERTTIGDRFCRIVSQKTPFV